MKIIYLNSLNLGEFEWKAFYFLPFIAYIEHDNYKGLCFGWLNCLIFIENQ